MYLCAKLIGFASAILSAGTISPLVIPYLKSSNNSWLFKQDSSTHKYDFQELDNTVDKRLEKLRHWFAHFSSAKTASEALKKLELDKMKPLFDQIFATEESIQKLFEKISETLTNLVKKHKEFLEASTKKLTTEKQKKLQETLRTKYSELIKILEGWKESLSQISCAIENNTDNEKCKQTQHSISSFLSSINSLFTSLLTSNGGGEQNGQVKDDIQGAEKAKKDLEEVKKVLLESVRDFREQSFHYGTRFAFSLSNEKIATVLLVALETLANSLNTQIDTWKKSIEESNQLANTQTNEINKLQGQLSTSYKDYSDLQRLESLFQWWKEMFDETIMKNEDDKARETDTLKRRRKK